MDLKGLLCTVEVWAPFLVCFETLLSIGAPPSEPLSLLLVAFPRLVTSLGFCQGRLQVRTKLLPHIESTQCETKNWSRF